MGRATHRRNLRVFLKLFVGNLTDSQVFPHSRAVEQGCSFIRKVVNLMRIPRSAAPILLAATLAVGLVGCSTPTPTPVTPETEASQPAPEETTAAPSGDGDAASFAKPVTTPGELLTSVTGEGFQVDIYQVGTATASKTGQFANPDTNTPIIEVGAELVYVNYVVTNTGADDIPLSYSLVTVKPRYDDWPFAQGMDSVVDLDQYVTMEVNNGAIAPGVGEAPFIWEPGTSFSFGENFLYQAGSPIEFTVALIPADESGDLVHDEKQEIKVSTTIK